MWYTYKKDTEGCPPFMPKRDPNHLCPAQHTLHVIGGRWKIPIVWRLQQGTHRFSELRRALEGVTQKMLAQQLRELESDGIVGRTVYPQVPPKVEYWLTQSGRSLAPVVEAMCKWGAKRGSCNPRKVGGKR